jgi:predicted transposase/invertase (TIGR01784 family)
MLNEKYINPFTDFGFKKLFGEEGNKDLLIDFLNELLADKGKITQLTFLKTEQLGNAEPDRKAVFDLYCQNDKGEKFIVELQKAKQKYFKDRSIYYATFAIQEQAQKGEWDYELQGVYTISILDFLFDETETEANKFLHEVALIEKISQKLFFDKIRFIYLEMPKFNKQESELVSHFDKWLYVIKNLSRLDNIPAKLHEKIFLKLFKVAEIANYSTQERDAYQASLKYYRDWKNVMDTAIEEALEEKVMEIARGLKASGVEPAVIAKNTGLSLAQIEKL